MNSNFNEILLQFTICSKCKACTPSSLQLVRLRLCFVEAGPDVPVLRIGRVPLVHKECFKYLGMMFHKRMSMAKPSEHAAGPFMASAYRI